MGLRVLPSVKASTDTSGPVRNSSTTTWAPLSPKILSSMMECRAALDSSSFWAMMTPLPRARPSALMTAGYFPWSLMYSRAAAGSAKTSYPAVGMRYFFIRFLENTLLASIWAAAALGPKQGIPAASIKSTMPAARGSSGATNTKSTCFSLARANMPSLSMAFTGKHSASRLMPPLPGAQYRASTRGLSFSLRTIACSRPPLPITNIFIGSHPFSITTDATQPSRWGRQSPRPRPFGEPGWCASPRPWRRPAPGNRR